MWLVQDLLSPTLYVNGWSFIIDSISVTITSDFPRIFLMPISRSHHPPYQGARLGFKFQSFTWAASVSCIFSELRSRFISSDAEAEVVALSDMIKRGVLFLLVKRLNACINYSSAKSFTNSICIALVEAHMNKQIFWYYCFPLLHIILQWKLSLWLWMVRLLAVEFSVKRVDLLGWKRMSFNFSTS